MKSHWTKETALAELRALADEAKKLGGPITTESPICPNCGGYGQLAVPGGGGRKCPVCQGVGRVPITAFSAEHTRWMTRCLAVFEEVFGRKSRYYLSFAALRWQETGSFIIGGPGDPGGSWNPQGSIDRRHHQAYLRDLGMACGLLLGASDELERSDLASVYEGKDTGPESSLIVKVINLAGPKLRTIIRSTPRNEKEVQEAFENLLVGADIPYSREMVRIEYGPKTYVPDFALEQIDLAVEVKLCAESRREKQIVAEINDDILAYQTRFGNILFVVYDVGQIRDVERFIAAFEQHENVVVRVVKQ